ncbi:hypothetical protein AZ78_2140 [Lysobacter capsici AZ78]|uniref:Uncharacterized protein n=1 Tax=Lysobacter capsici AZ78 TaxID=1444315 RepID=A0A108U8M4_9GAMM|nr:hypothetical protein AZ78_2140 [Lysobacter capsici AZ78]
MRCGRHGKLLVELRVSTRVRPAARTLVGCGAAWSVSWTRPSAPLWEWYRYRWW